MKKLAKTNSTNRRLMVQATVMALVVASALPARADMRIPELSPPYDTWIALAQELMEPATDNTEAGHLSVPLMNIKGEVNGINEPLGKAAEQPSTLPVPLRRVPLPESERESVELTAEEEALSEPARSVAIAVDQHTHRLSFGTSHHCRRFVMVCNLIGIP